jgi:tetratricopeptide (TPR) repeat protein
MDDEVQILGNSHLKLENIWDLFKSSTMSSGGGIKLRGLYFKPLMTMFYVSVWNTLGHEPFYFRIPLLIIFFTNSFLVFLFSKKFLKENYAFILAVLFLLHPVNTEVGVYLADAQDLFYFFFGLLSLLVISKEKMLKIDWCFYISLLVFATLSKETGVLFLGINVFYVWFFKRTETIRTFFTSILVFLLYVFWRFHIGLTKMGSYHLDFAKLGFFDRLKIFPMIFSHYVEIFFVPIRLTIASDYLLTSLSFENFYLPLLILLIFSTALFFTYKYLKNNLMVPFFLLVFGLWLLLHTHLIIPLDGIYCDRWAYLFVWIVLSLLFIFLQSLNLNFKKIIIFSIIISLVFIGRIYIRLQDWNEPLRFYLREAEIHPYDSTMTNNVGVEYFRQGEISMAKSYFEKSIELNNHWSVSLNNLGATYDRYGDYLNAQKYYMASVKTGDDYALGYINLTKVLIRLNKINEAKSFLKEKALPLFPQNAEIIQLARDLNI